MQVLTNVVIGDANDAEAIGESLCPIDEWRGCEIKGIDLAKFAMLQAVLTGQTFDEAYDEYRPVVAASDEGPWVFRFPGASLEKLAALEEEALEQVGEELAATEEFEQSGYPVEAVQAVLEELSDLAKVCVSQGKTMFIWMSL
jgi:hypothetical protein